MKSKVTIYGHPVHPMLIAFPLGLLPASLLTDLVRAISGAPYWGLFSFWLIVAGVVSGLGAGLVGFIDWWHLPREAKKARVLGAAHGLSNLVMIVLFTATAVLRFDRPEQPPAMAIALSIIALFLGIVGGWLGGELVFRMGVGVHENASLRDRA